MKESCAERAPLLFLFFAWRDAGAFQQGEAGRGRQIYEARALVFFQVGPWSTCQFMLTSSAPGADEPRWRHLRSLGLRAEDMLANNTLGGWTKNRGRRHLITADIIFLSAQSCRKSVPDSSTISERFMVARCDFVRAYELTWVRRLHFVYSFPLTSLGPWPVLTLEVTSWLHLAVWAPKKAAFLRAHCLGWLTTTQHQTQPQHVQYIL